MILLFILLIGISNINSDLSEEERNLRCCVQKASCCKIRPTSFEIISTMEKCSKESKVDDNESVAIPKTVVRTVRSSMIEENCRDQNGIKNCKRKLKMTIKIKNIGFTNCKTQYLLIDHVFDGITQQKQKLFNPYVLRVIQEPVMAVYGLSYDGVVNANAHEMVINKNVPGYVGCNPDSISNPVCGSVSYRSNIVPYSNGFCCSCDQKEEKNSNYLNISQIPYNFKYHRPLINNWAELPEALNNLNIHTTTKKSVNLTTSGPIKAVSNYKLVHKRGGQDCNDKSVPSNILNPEHYHSSSHCLRFSDLWYNVYKIQKPKIRHSLTIQIFEKYQTLEGSCKWRDLTKKNPIKIGTEDDNYINDESTLAINYTKRDFSDVLFTLNPQLHKLLIPDVSTIEDKEAHPEIKAGASEYLVVKNNQIQLNGKSCNVAGVGYEAFVKQPNKCSVPKGTCLKNQPSMLWQEDHDYEINGLPGHYFLKYFGTIPDKPIDSTQENKTLSLYYTNSYISLLEVELRAEDNPVLRPNSQAVITEVYTENTNLHKTSITVKVFNAGVMQSVFYVGLTDCPMSLPASFSHIYSKPALIPPQHQHVYNIEIQYPLPAYSFMCSLHVLNMNQELIAIRNIRLAEKDRCICLWHCSCSCYTADYGLKCRPLSLEAYHIAGFEGGEPIALQVLEYTVWDDIIAMLLYIFITVCLTLLIMGLLKGLLGICFIPIGLWGLDVVLDLPKKLHQYHEQEINHMYVIYDSSGWPIHPITKEKVRNIPVTVEFCINLIFFGVYPFCIVWYLFKKLCSDDLLPNDIDVCYCRQGRLVKRRNCGLQSSLSNISYYKFK